MLERISVGVLAVGAHVKPQTLEQNLHGRV